MLSLQWSCTCVCQNTGNWDTTELRKGKGAAARGPRQPTMLAGLSRYPCTPTSTNPPLEIIPEHDHDLDNGQEHEDDLNNGQGHEEAEEHDHDLDNEHEEAEASAAAAEEAALGRWRGDFEMEIESSWSCVSQHGVGNSLFSHNLVTISGRLNWSLQVSRQPETHTHTLPHPLLRPYVCVVWYLSPISMSPTWSTAAWRRSTPRRFTTPS